MHFKNTINWVRTAITPEKVHIKRIRTTPEDMHKKFDASGRGERVVFPLGIRSGAKNNLLSLLIITKLQNM